MPSLSSPHAAPITLSAVAMLPLCLASKKKRKKRRKKKERDHNPTTETKLQHKMYSYFLLYSAQHNRRCKLSRSDRHLRYTLYSSASYIQTIRISPSRAFCVQPRQETLALFLKKTRREARSSQLPTWCYLDEHLCALTRCFCAHLLVAATTNFHSASSSFCNVL